MEQKITCPCGVVFTAEFDEEINLDQNPEHIDRIMDGSFMNYICPECGKKHKPEFPLIVLWPAKKLKIETLGELDRGEFYRRKKDPPGAETVIGYPELADRIAVIHDGLEPVAVEALKYFLLLKAEETYPDLRVSVWYHGLGANVAGHPECIEFHLHGIRSDEVAVSRLPWGLYEKTLEDFRKRPKQELFSSLRVRSYLSAHNMLRPEVLK
ncbi:MAG TPA: hypothetical protein DEQ14_00010 [Treponema sp.]|nr:hypothetical protein [Treponema sp.]